MILDADTATNLRHDLQKLHTGGPLVVDLFAGPGGWDEGLRATGYTGSIIGVEWDESACATASAAGHPRLRADIAALDPTIFGDVEGLIASPPCQAWSVAGDRKGELDRPEVFARITAHARNRKPRHVVWHDERSALTAEPMRWIAALRPRWVALEQVPPVLPLWEHTATLLREIGYKAWTGVLSAECYGVPQTRKRAILIARRDGVPVGPPEPTHQAYRPGNSPATGPDLFGDPLPPPVSMAEALGWSSNGVVISNYGTGGNSQDRGERRFTEPSSTVTSKIDRFKVRTEIALRNGSQDNATVRGVTEPAGTIYCSRPGNLSWSLSNASQGNSADWVHTRPSTTVCGDARIGRPGHKDRAGGEAQFAEDSVRVTVQEAGVLQGFPPDYPWQGTKGAQYRQVGDAVPPPLAAAILRPLVASTAGRAAA